MRNRVLLKQKEECVKEKSELQKKLAENLLELEQERAKLREAELLNAQLIMQDKIKFKSGQMKQKHKKIAQIKQNSGNMEGFNFICSFEGCGKSYGKKDSFNRHKLRHKTKCICDICGMTFNQISDIRRHMVRHSGNFAFACKICTFKSGQKSNLTRHLKCHSQKAK